jgi:hypothetical protein
MHVTNGASQPLNAKPRTGPNTLGPARRTCDYQLRPCAMGAGYYVGRDGGHLRLPLIGDRPPASVAHPPGGYSLAIPVSLITRSYLAS